MPVKGSSKVQVGKMFKSNSSGMFEVIETSGKYAKVEFPTGHTAVATQSQILAGWVKDPYFKSIYGVGYIGEGPFVAKGRHYSRWNSMIRRCYDTECTLNKKQYNGCSVTESWHNFQNFMYWSITQLGHLDKNFQLDKDLKVKDNKIYSPETCSYVPREVNVALIVKHTKSVTNISTGVTYKPGSKTYKVSIGNGNRITGEFNTLEEAEAFYKISKETYVKELATTWQAQLESDVYESLLNWKV